MLFGSSIINVLRGPAHFSKVVEEIVHRNKYDPIYGKCNFAIPSAKTLQKLDVGYPKDIPCGMVEHTLDIASEQSKDGKQFTLSFNGKLVTQGAISEKTGDVDLWGKEGEITVNEALKQCDKLISAASSLEMPITHTSLHGHLFKVRTMSCNISYQICKLRCQCKSHFFNREKLFKLVENNPKRSLSLCKNTIVMCGNTPLTIRETETLMSNDLYI